MQNNKFVDDSKVLKRDIRINTNKKESIRLQKNCKLQVQVSLSKSLRRHVEKSKCNIKKKALHSWIIWKKNYFFSSVYIDAVSEDLNKAKLNTEDYTKQWHCTDQRRYAVSRYVKKEVKFPPRIKIKGEKKGESTDSIAAPICILIYSATMLCGLT